MEPALLDTDTVSQIIRARNAATLQHASDYLRTYGQLTISIITRYEVLRGLKTVLTSGRLAAFERFCRDNQVLPLTDEIVNRAAEVYADLRSQGRPIGDADVLIGATALVQDLALVTSNTAHFSRIEGLRLANWTL